MPEADVMNVHTAMIVITMMNTVVVTVAAIIVVVKTITIGVSNIVAVVADISDERPHHCAGALAANPRLQTAG